MSSGSFRCHRSIGHGKPLKTLELKSNIISVVIQKLLLTTVFRIDWRKVRTVKKLLPWIIWLARLGEQVSLDLRILSSSPTFSMEPI